MPLIPVRKILVSDGILEQLREMIYAGELPPEARIPPELKLAQELSVSRSSLREALNALVHMGCLYRKNKGLYVAPESRWKNAFSANLKRSLKEEQIGEMIEVRKIVEAEICSLAAKRATGEDITQLEEIFAEMKKHLHDPQAFAHSNHKFHLAIAASAKNEILKDLIEKLRDMLKDNISQIILRSQISARSLAYHQRILAAIKDGDAKRARAAMSAHLADVEKEFVKILYRRKDLPEEKT